MSSHIDAAIENLALLRATERTNPELGETLEPVIEQLCQFAGATVPRATAARLLGVSQPALDRWIDLREVSSVLTPTGRRAVPTDYLVELLDDVRQPFFLAAAPGMPDRYNDFRALGRLIPRATRAERN